MHKKDDTIADDVSPEDTSPEPNLIEELKKQKEEYLSGWKRERADFLNYKREEMERITDLMKYASAELIIKLLPILDNFMVAEQNIPPEVKEDKNIAGLLQINQQLKVFLKSQGIEEIKAVGEKFDPNFHEAVDEIEAEGKEHGIIVEETQRGYTLYSKVIRPSKVKIAK
ncbi:MAG: nucleotide exchange factor GrpE [Candidatus Staskawiczbacteria bacterium]|jgi:molecular chaperone GrpE